MHAELRLAAFRDAVMRAPLHHFAAGRIISLEGATILGDAALGNTIYVRPEYVRLQQHILALIDANERKPRVAVVGNPGVGLTFFGYYWLVQCIRVGRTVVYESATSPGAPYLFSEGKASILGGRHDPVFEDAVQERGTVYIVDGLVPAHAAAQTILVASSPHPDVYHRFAWDCTAPAAPLCMPAWTTPELAALRAAVYPHVDPAVMAARLARWGGIPRAVLEDAPVGKGAWRRGEAHDDGLEAAVHACSVEDVVGRVDEGCRRFQTSHRVLHVQCNASYRNVGYVFASDYVRDAVLTALTLNPSNLRRLVEFAVNADSRSDPALSGLRAQVCEYVARLGVKRQEASLEGHAAAFTAGEPSVLQSQLGCVDATRTLQL